MIYAVDVVLFLAAAPKRTGSRKRGKKPINRKTFSRNSFLYSGETSLYKLNTGTLHIKEVRIKEKEEKRKKSKYAYPMLRKKRNSKTPRPMEVSFVTHAQLDKKCFLPLHSSRRATTESTGFRGEGRFGPCGAGPERERSRRAPRLI